MSGFVAVARIDGGPADGALVDRLTATMAFRGPDGQDSWTRGPVGLGHAGFRATVESDRETQPLSVDGDVWITADARIDDRGTLVRRLGERGVPATIDTPDAELVLRSYLTWGDQCLDALIGDFAFVIWDARRRRLFAARDQLGVAQLFVTQTDTTLILGNTLHPLLQHPGVPQTLDEQVLADVALFTYALDDAATGYAAIRRIPPGHVLTWDAGVPRIARYWSLPQPAAIRYRDPQQYAQHFRALFDEAVADRLRGDRAGAQLSGGMDSTSIAVTAASLLQGSGRPFDLRGYSVEHRALIPDEEASLATAVGNHAGFPVEVLDGEAFMGLEPDPAPAWVPPEPGAATIWVMAEICRRTAAFAPVLLTGYGGDPLLHPPAVSWRRAASAVRQRAWRWPLRPVKAELYRRHAQRRPDPVPAWADPAWAQRAGLADRPADLRARSPLEQTGIVQAPLWRTLFAAADAGYHGLPLSIRFPFFDLRLLEFVLAIPPVPWLEDKRLLRAAIGDRLPETIRARPKTGMRGDVVREHIAQNGIPAWQLEVLGDPAMAPYIAAPWLQALRDASPAAQADSWARERPPIHLAYWLRHRPRWDTVNRATTRQEAHCAAPR